MENDNSQLDTYISDVKKNGYARVVVDSRELYLVLPKWREGSAPAPFDKAGHLLEQPLRRSAYSDRTAWLMATLSELAYLPFEKDQSKKENLILTLNDAELVLREIFDNEETGTQAFLVQRPGEFCALVFRGTEKNRKDILTDLNARFYKTASGHAHKGFAMAYESVQKHINDALEEVESQGGLKQLFIAGHSLGGALATYAASQLDERFTVAACYTFGSPRVGTAEWSDAVKSPVYRVVNGADGVPLVPGSNFLRWVMKLIPQLPYLGWLEEPINKLIKRGFVGYQHAGDLRFIKGDMDNAVLKIGSSASWARIKYLVVGKIIGAIKALKPGALSATFSDHSISHYAEKLKHIAEIRN
ncbi:MAG: lipase family protein [Pseudomonadota bacterium]|nr:lipase family protein [Pseudomonadota bacterium]